MILFLAAQVQVPKIGALISMSLECSDQWVARIDTFDRGSVFRLVSK